MIIKNKNINEDSFVLRLVIGPYVIYPVIIILVTLLWVPYVLKTHDWGPMEAIGIVIIFFGITIYMDTRYRIWWQDGKIMQKAVSGAITTIKVDEIKQIEQETSDLQTLLSMSRPSKRITIYGSTSEGLKVIDVSLKHFNLEDVRKLMKVIHDHRPDLQMPKNWI